MKEEITVFDDAGEITDQRIFPPNASNARK